MNSEHLKQWQKEKGDYSYRLDYDLNENSIVFDVGGYKGWFAEHIYNKYKCNVYVFEPIGTFFEAMKVKFKNIPKIKVFNYGISSTMKQVDFYLNDDSTSAHRNYKNKGVLVTSSLVGIKEVLEDLKIHKIDLIKINIEGDEFPLIEKILSENIVTKFKDIQVQFHQWVENSKSKRDFIRKELIKTHILTYDFEFIWENWRLKK